MCTAASSSTPRCLNAEHERSVETVEAQEKGGGAWGRRMGCEEGGGHEKGDGKNGAEGFYPPLITVPPVGLI